jgi:hypothetical protein
MTRHLVLKKLQIMNGERRVFTTSELDSFHYDERANYWIFDPKSPDEKERLEQLLGAPSAGALPRKK